MTILSPPDAGAVAGSRRSLRLLVGALLLLNGLYAFNQMLVVPVLPTIERDLHTSTTRVTWLLSFFLMVSCVATPILGKLSDQFGRRRLLLAVLATFFVGNVAAVLAPNIWVLIGARGLQGASGALTPIAIGLLSDILPREALHRALGGIMSAAMTGSGVGAAVSGLVVDHLSWRYLFAISGAVVLGCALVVARTTPADARRSAAPVDVRGAVLLSASLVSLLLALTEGDSWGWTSGPVAGLFAASAASFALWLVHERRIPWPLVDVRVLGRRTVLVANVAQAVNSLAMAAAIILVPRLVGMSRDVPGRPGLDPGYGLGASTTVVGLYLLPIALSGIVAGHVAWKLGRRLGFGRSLLLGQLTGATALAAMIPWHDHGWQIVLLMLAFGFTIPLVNTSINAIVMDTVPPEDAGVSTGVIVTFRQIGATIGGQLTAAILATSVLAGTTVPGEGAFQAAFGFAAASCAIGVAVGLVGLGRAARRPVAPPGARARAAD